MVGRKILSRCEHVLDEVSLAPRIFGTAEQSQRASLVSATERGDQLIALGQHVLLEPRERRRRPSEYVARVTARDSHLIVNGTEVFELPGVEPRAVFGQGRRCG